MQVYLCLELNSHLEAKHVRVKSNSSKLNSISGDDFKLKIIQIILWSNVIEPFIYMFWTFKHNRLNKILKLQIWENLHTLSDNSCPLSSLTLLFSTMASNYFHDSVIKNYEFAFLSDIIDNFLCVANCFFWIKCLEFSKELEILKHELK